jgi:hypothetical protein
MLVRVGMSKERPASPPPMRPVLSKKLIELERKRIKLEEERRARKRRKAGRSDPSGLRSTARLAGAMLSAAMTMNFVRDMLPGDLHAKRVESIAGGVAGVLKAGSMAVSAIGKGYAAFSDGAAKHGIKQVDRMLSNAKISVDDFFLTWIPSVVGERAELTIAMDWTEFDADSHSTLALTAMTDHGRGTLLFWRTYASAELSDGGRTDAEDEVLLLLKAALPSDVHVTLVADRGFGDQALYAMLGKWSWDYVIRFRGDILVTTSDGITKPAKEWLSPSGRARKLTNVQLTANRTPVPAIVAVKAKDMKDAWFLATSLKDQPSGSIVRLYGRRFTIEETFRDLKDPRYGLGMHSIHVSRTDRRDRLIMLFAIAHALLTLLGAASEQIGYDRTLRANTVRTRTHSLFNQGKFFYECIPNMSDRRLRPLIEAYVEILANHPLLSLLCGSPTNLGISEK